VVPGFRLASMRQTENLGSRSQLSVLWFVSGLRTRRRSQSRWVRGGKVGYSVPHGARTGQGRGSVIVDQKPELSLSSSTSDHPGSHLGCSMSLKNQHIAVISCSKSNTSHTLLAILYWRSRMLTCGEESANISSFIRNRWLSSEPGRRQFHRLVWLSGLCF